MNDKEFRKLKIEVLELISNVMQNTTPELLLEFREGLAQKVLALPNILSIEEIFKGVIGYRVWGVRNDIADNVFLTHVLCELRETTCEFDKKGFTPHLKRYIEYYMNPPKDKIKFIDSDCVEINGVIYKKEYQQDREFMKYKLSNN